MTEPLTVGEFELVFEILGEHRRAMRNRLNHAKSPDYIAHCESALRDVQVVIEKLGEMRQERMLRRIRRTEQWQWRQDNIGKIVDPG
jgi:hypothetical protein